ncbi:class I adenylate-forming enzyme family protein [Mycolicibacterium sp. F2034L]|uniref:class I adenylate-forming enzyme family protein n=1 Tax=Mycolicibacterium sp. F2034L TaxID=2926422 RepID=UPI001FF637AB|nr:fatty acid--CoA ligase family protein [Mycolicibacterium sp. F2034L]MCK0172645.1 fatty acid--CoA ligase family protein [Mycolicibacterium sp. F2034L]
MTDGSAPSFAETFGAGFASYRDRPCIWFEGRWHTGTEVTGYAAALESALADAGVGRQAPLGLVVRNRLPHAAAIGGFLAGGRRVSMIYSFQSPEAIAADVERLEVAAVVADVEDWTAPVRDAAHRCGRAGVAISTAAPHLVTKARGAQPVGRGAGLEILTSGTTGPPKRQAIDAKALQRTVFSVTGGLLAAPDDPPELSYWPFGGIGVCQLIAGFATGKRIVLLEKFTVDGWVRAVRDHGIPRGGVQPAVIRMLLDADIPAADLAPLQYLISASGPLDPRTRDEFEQRYGIPVQLAYGATEFAGSVCAWTPELVERYGTSKRNSVGRALPDTEVRIVDPDSGAELPAGARGLLEARIPVLNPDWIRTTDVASMDDDGFVTLHGRADGAIIRGGFKILPETVRQVLIDHPGVRDVCVVGVRDDRLGAVPFAAFEPAVGQPVPSAEELQEWVRATLPAHHVPVAVVAVDELPRTASLKVRIPEVKALYRAV